MKEVRRRGYVVNHKRVARLMKVHILCIKSLRRFKRTTDSSHNSPDLSKPVPQRHCEPAGRGWAADFTYIRIETGFCYCNALKEAGPRGSMSSLGKPYHDAQAESLITTLRTEDVYIAHYGTSADLANRQPRFIDEVYNARRLHSALGCRPPNEFESQLAPQAA